MEEQKEKKQPREFVPGAKELELLKEIAGQIAQLDTQRQGMLRLIMKQNGLEGNFSWDGNKLIEVV